MGTRPVWVCDVGSSFHGLASDSLVEVTVVGAGVTGCSCALSLARRGLSVRVLDATGVAAGASGRNGGFALRGTAQSYDGARAALGVAEARDLWQQTEGALDRMSEIAGDALRRVGSLRLAVDEAELAELRREYDALAEDGFDVNWIERPNGRLGEICLGGIEHPPDGALEPARWVGRLAGVAVAEGVEFVEGRRVDTTELASLAGSTGAVVVALDAWTGELLPEVAQHVRPCRGQVIATEPQAEILYGRPHYSRGAYDYWHQRPDGRLIFGGRRDKSPHGEATTEDATTEAIQVELEGFATVLLGREVRVTHRWSGSFGVTDDLLPLVGPVPGRERVWVAGGYSGHGNVLGFLCGELVAAAIAEGDMAGLALFEPGRFNATAG